MSRQIVLIGAGQSSASAARTLRRLEFSGGIVIVGDEAHAPYQRPPLSKEYLQGSSTVADLWSTPLDWYSNNNVRLQLGTRALRADKRTMEVELDSGGRLKAEAILIATGGTPRRLPGAVGESIFYLRTLEDADRIRAHLKPGRRVLIVGAGFIGSEIAASARTLGAEVTMLEMMKTPLERVLGETLGAICGAIHKENGVDLRCGVTIKSITPAGGGVVIETHEGHTIEGDIAIVGIGIAPNVEVAKASEITVGNGIRVDEFCRTTAAGIFAAGDVANHYHPLFDCRMRVEHFDNATRQGEAAAMNMLGIRTRYDSPHWFWSDQYGHSMQYTGHASRWDEIVIRGSAEERNFVAFYLQGGRIVGAFGLNRGGDILLVKSLLSSRVEVNASDLRDEDVDLGELVSDSCMAEGSADDVGALAVDDGNFHRVARSGQVAEGCVRRFVVAETEVALARMGGKVYALHNLCTHLACHLSAGRVDRGGLTCLCHGSVFDLATGEPINPPATRPVRTYPVREADGHIYVAVK
jgi:3-phenylpropionate/trans-cinnamate dioxygenase ferredoxin reductase subunit